MTKYQPISCDLHDYIEIACLYGYELRIAAIGGRTVTGTACHTLTTPDKAEYLELEINGMPQRLRLDEIVQIEPLSPGAQFGIICFRKQS